MTNTTPSSRRRFEGVVVSTAMQATAVAVVNRRVADRKYGKYYTISKKFMVHDPEKTAHVGDTILFEECRPLSRHKRWRYLSTVKSAAKTA